MDCKGKVSQVFKINPQGSRITGRPKTDGGTVYKQGINKCEIENQTPCHLISEDNTECNLGITSVIYYRHPKLSDIFCGGKTKLDIFVLNFITVFYIQLKFASINFEAVHISLLHITDFLLEK
jgi:hypothetical protein